MKQKTRPAVSIPTIEETERELIRIKYKKRYLRVFRNTIFALVIVAAAALLFSSYFMPVVKVTGNGMAETLEKGDIVFLWSEGTVDNGDVIACYAGNQLTVRRVIGVAGDIIDIDDEGNVILNGEVLRETYAVNKDSGAGDETYPITVPRGKYFVLSDDRENNYDSRLTSVGMIDEDETLGKAFLRVRSVKPIAIIR